jgi:pilus assembly protein Flp/PilA
MAKLFSLVRRFTKRSEGAAMVEYGLLVALIAVACIVVTRLLGQEVSSVFSYVQTSLAGVV